MCALSGLPRSSRRYFAELIAIPRLAPRLRSWATKMRFHTQASELLERQKRLHRAFEALLSSEALHVALGLLLALGNALNAGTARANAFGFRLDTTLEAMSTSSKASPTSVIGFLARHAMRTAPHLAGEVAKAAKQLAPSVRLDATELATEASTLATDVKSVASALAVHEEVEAKAAAKRKQAADAARATVHAAMEAARQGKPVVVDLPVVAGAPGGVTDSDVAGADSAAQEGAAADDGSSDRFAPVMRTFVTDATARMAEVGEASAALEGSAAKVCAFLCEREDPSVTSAHTLLCRLHAFANGLVAAHEQMVSEKQAAAEKQAKAQEQRVTRSSSSKKGVAAAAAAAAAATDDAGVAFEASEASLRAIMEDGGGAAAEGAQGERRDTSGRRLTHAAPKSPDELQALFTRRATMGTIEKGSASKGREPPPCSPGKRPRRSMQEAGAADDEGAWRRPSASYDNSDEDE